MLNRIKTQSIQIIKPEWKTIGVKVRLSELSNLNRQLDQFGYITLGDLVKNLMAGKITRLTDDQQIDIMKTNIPANGQTTGFQASLMIFTNKLTLKIFKAFKK